MPEGKYLTETHARLKAISLNWSHTKEQCVTWSECASWKVNGYRHRVEVAVTGWAWRGSEPKLIDCIYRKHGHVISSQEGTYDPVGDDSFISMAAWNRLRKHRLRIFPASLRPILTKASRFLFSKFDLASISPSFLMASPLEMSPSLKQSHPSGKDSHKHSTDISFLVDGGWGMFSNGNIWNS